MSADKRTVSTDALETLGMIHAREEKRDAIHLAVIPAEAGEDLSANDDVHLLDGKAYRTGYNSKDAIGKVDPFLKTQSYFAVKRGQRFWVVIYPRVITSLRHVWTHPQIADEIGTPKPDTVSDEQKAKSEAWLRQWISNADCPSYDTVMKIAVGESIGDEDDYVSYRIEDYGDGPSIFLSGTDGHSSIPPEFWDHVEIVTGKKVPVRAVGFSCSC